jgi:hypothetical protein
MLAMQVPVGLSNHIGSKQGIRPTLGSEMFIPFRCDLTVNDNVGDMDTLWPKLACHGLGKRSQPKFGNSKIGKSGAAAERSGGTGEDNRPGPSWDHQSCRRLTHKESAEAANSPATLEVLRPKVKHIPSFVGAGIEDHDGRSSQLLADCGEQARHITGVGDITIMEPYCVQAIALRGRAKSVTASRSAHHVQTFSGKALGESPA